MLVYKLKTAFYTIIGPLSLGLILGGIDDEKLEDVKNFGEKIGVAFQIQDDILGIYSDMGKVIGSDIKEFKQKEFIDLGNNKYHHSIKSYKKLIRILKRKYIFKNYDIMFLDNFIITPYLYSSLNEEKQVSDDLNKVIDKYFEFNNTNLKRVIIKNISEVKNEVPLWEKRGKSLKEVE